MVIVRTRGVVIVIVRTRVGLGFVSRLYRLLALVEGLADP